MPSPPDPTKKIQIRAPVGATHWCCWRVISKNVAAGENGRREKCTSEPGSDGKVPDAWPVEDFSTARVLENWGPGKYRVDWYDANGQRLKEHGELFDVAQPRKRGRPPGPRLGSQPSGGSSEDVAPPLERVAQAVGNGTQIGLIELLALLQSREDAAEARAQRAADRQVDMLARQQEQMMTLLSRMSDRPASSGDADLLRRELSQTLREGMFQLRRELIEREDDEPEEPEDGPQGPPQDLTEAGERIAMSFLQDLEKRAPEALPKVIEFLSRKVGVGGVPPNGRAHGS